MPPPPISGGGETEPSFSNPSSNRPQLRKPTKSDECFNRGGAFDKAAYRRATRTFAKEIRRPDACEAIGGRSGAGEADASEQVATSELEPDAPNPDAADPTVGLSAILLDLSITITPGGEAVEVRIRHHPPSVELNCAEESFASECRILLLGMGADEQMGAASSVQ